MQGRQTAESWAGERQTAKGKQATDGDGQRQSVPDRDPKCLPSLPRTPALASLFCVVHAHTDVAADVRPVAKTQRQGLGGVEGAPEAKEMDICGLRGKGRTVGGAGPQEVKAMRTSINC